LINIISSNVETLVGYNYNYKDVVDVINIQFTGKYVCKMVEGRNDGKESIFIGDQCQSTSIFKCTCNYKKEIKLINSNNTIQLVE